jgi:hypothetical protein
MAQAGFAAVNELLRILSDPTGGIEPQLAELGYLRGADVDPTISASVVQHNVGADLLDKTGMATYPALHVTCERVSNDLREKFRIFSGTVGLAIEVRVTHDRAEALEGQVHAVVDAVTSVLDSSRGEWNRGMVFSGAYEITFAAAKRGGRNYVQSAKVRLNVNVSM